MTTSVPPDAAAGSQAHGSVGEVFVAFLKLGVMSFGGPIAHLGYYREELVVHRRWLDEATYADLVALCQFLPGPASSQVGFSLGVLRGNGLLGGLAAWLAFTLPSAVIMFAFANLASRFTGPLAQGFLHGLKLVAVAVVAQAIWGMSKSLTPDRPRAAIALAALAVVVLFPGSFAQVSAIALGAVAGLWLCRDEAAPVSGGLNFPVSRHMGGMALMLFVVLLLVTPFVAAVGGSHGLAVFDAFYRSGALVFGGGHVVLPLLQAEVVTPGWVSNEAFLAGYGLAQAVPGPLFTFAAYLGAAMGPEPHGWLGALVCLIAIFAPSFLLVIGFLPFWDRLRRIKAIQNALMGINAVVVGLLLAALYTPVWTSAINGPLDFALALVAFVLLVIWRAPPWAVVILSGLGGWGVQLLVSAL